MLIACGDDLFCGDTAACDVGVFDRTIHVWRPSDVSDHATCHHLAGAPNTTNLRIQWREEETLAQLGAQLPRIQAFAQPPGRLLVHCRSGHCRGPHITVLAAVARGLDPFGVIDQLNRARYAQAGGVPAWKWPDINSILRLANDPGST